MTQMFKSGYLTFPWSNSLRLGKDSFFSTIMQIRHYCNSHASSGSGALRSQSSVHCCVGGGGRGGALPSQMRAAVSRSYPGGGLPLHNSGSSDVYVYPWRRKRGELCVCPQANGRLALARVPSPLRLHFQICEQNRNDNTRHMSL